MHAYDGFKLPMQGIGNLGNINAYFKQHAIPWETSMLKPGWKMY